jgi:peptidoglycan/xylan/chitin deacetylase (PgdA/CDA1 family)
MRFLAFLAVVPVAACAPNELSRFESPLFGRAPPPLSPGAAEGSAQSTKFPAPMVSFTFDDGWANQDVAGAELVEHGWRATYYIVPSWLDTQDFMSHDTVRSLSTWHEIGAHTMTHPDLEHLAPDLVAYEMGSSQAWLTNFLGGNSVTSFASPFGDFNDSVVEVAQKIFSSHRTLGCVVALANQDPNKLPGCPVHGTVDEKVQQMNQMMDEAKAKNGWAIFVFHRVTLDDTGAASDFQHFVDAVAQANVRVVTVGEGAAMLRRQQAGAPLDVTDPLFGDHAPW